MVHVPWGSTSIDSSASICAGAGTAVRGTGFTGSHPSTVSTDRTASCVRLCVWAGVLGPVAGYSETLPVTRTHWPIVGMATSALPT